MHGEQNNKKYMNTFMYDDFLQLSFCYIVIFQENTKHGEALPLQIGLTNQKADIVSISKVELALFTITELFLYFGKIVGPVQIYMRK